MFCQVCAMFEYYTYDQRPRTMHNTIMYAHSRNNKGQ